MRKSRTLDLVICGLFTALIIVGAFIRIDFILPITLQSNFVVIAGMILGRRKGAVCAVSYMVLGLAGLPVFAQGGGLMYVLKPSFGYILGFIAGAFMSGFAAEHSKSKTVKSLYFSGLTGVLCIYLIGVVYFCLVMMIYVKAPEAELLSILRLTVFAALPADLIFLVPSSIIAKRVRKALRST